MPIIYAMVYHHFLSPFSLSPSLLVYLLFSSTICYARINLPHCVHCIMSETYISSPFECHKFPCANERREKKTRRKNDISKFLPLVWWRLAKLMSDRNNFNSSGWSLSLSFVCFDGWCDNRESKTVMLKTLLTHWILNFFQLNRCQNARPRLFELAIDLSTCIWCTNWNNARWIKAKVKQITRFSIDNINVMHAAKMEWIIVDTVCDLRNWFFVFKITNECWQSENGLWWNGLWKKKMVVNPIYRLFKHK